MNWNGSYTFRYAEIREEEVPILRGSETGNWGASQAEITWPSQVTIWQRANEANQAVQFHLQSWTNPYLEITIQSLDFVSKLTRSAPFFVAITAKQMFTQSLPP